MKGAAVSAWSGGGESNGHGERFWRVQSDLSVIGPIVEEIVILCRAQGFSPRQCRFNIPIAITEAVANAILRGNSGDVSRLVEVTAVVGEAHLTVEVADEGSGFNLLQLEQSPDDEDWYERENGRGIFLMRNLVDIIESVPTPNGRHCLRLTLNRA